ncbi:MAG: hypothetical protein ACKVWV_01645 [Planctomycetota bacterium]
MAIVVAALLLIVVAIPSVGQRSSTGPDSDLSRARAALNELRRAIGRYRYDHGVWPGASCGDVEDAGACFARQLTHASNAAGAFAASSVGADFGPYLHGYLPTNPLNGLSSVLLLPDAQDRPSPADGKSGWIYRPSTGELWINAPGEADGVRFIDL